MPRASTPRRACVSFVWAWKPPLRGLDVAVLERWAVSNGGFCIGSVLAAELRRFMCLL